MSRPICIRLSLALMMFAALACSIDLGIPLDAGSISTTAAQTIIASLTGSAASFTSTSTFPPPTVTLVTDTPTLTPTQTLTLTPPHTFTPLIPQISVSVATNCRSGPGKTYPRVGALTAGQVVQVYARDPSKRYWYIRNPDRANNFCWVWDEYATLTGTIAGLPIFTPPPKPTSTRTPTPTATASPTATAGPNVKFTLNYSGLEVCKGKKEWSVEFRLKNTGKVVFRSTTIIVQDVKKDIVLSKIMNGFDSMKGCKPTTHLNALAAGKSTIVSSEPFSFNVDNRSLRAWVILCTQANQKGQCVQRTLSFKP